MVGGADSVGRYQFGGAAVSRATADALTASRLPTKEVPTSVGDVLVRALSREESADIPDMVGLDREATIISRAVVDPPMTIEQVRAWMAAAPAGEFDKVSTAVGELSGLLESSGQDAYKSNGRRPRS